MNNIQNLRLSTVPQMKINNQSAGAASQRRNVQFYVSESKTVSGDGSHNNSKLAPSTKSDIINATAIVQSKIQPNALSRGKYIFIGC